MALASNLVVAFVALLHFYFLVLEMFLWEKPAGLRAFGMSREKAAASKVLAPVYRQLPLTVRTCGGTGSASR